MFDAEEMVQTLAKHFSTTANVGALFGEPIQGCGKTVIPIARVRSCPALEAAACTRTSRQGFLEGEEAAEW